MSTRPTRRERQRLARENARYVYRDDDFGLRLVERGTDRLQMRWDIPPQPDFALLAVERVRGLVDAITTEWVLALRADGESWSEVGYLLGITGEAARQRYSAAEIAQRAGVDGVSE